MLPYSAEVLFALHARYLQELWPIALPVAILTLGTPALALNRAPDGGRIAAGLLALAWLWVGLVFQLHYFAVINFAAPVYAGLFVAQSLLLFWWGPLRDRLRLAFRQDGRGRVGSLILIYAVIVYPLLDRVGENADGAVRLAGLAPGPTALFTIGLLLHARDRAPLPLLAIPLAWSLVAGFSGWVLGLPADLLAPVPAVFGVAAAVWYGRAGR